MALSNGDVEFTLKMSAGNAPQVMQQIVGNFAKMEQGAKRAAASARAETTSMARQGAASTAAMARTMGGIRNMVAGIAGGASLGMLWNDYIQGIERASQAQLKFEKDITPLLSLGTNIQNISGMKREVLDLSVGWRKNADEVASFMFNLQSGSANLPIKDIQAIKNETLELVEATGAALPTAMDLMLKGWQQYRGELASVNDLQNRFLKTQQDAYLTFDDLATRLPEIMPVAKLVGATVDDLMAMLIAASQVAGEPAKMFTSLRNILLIMETSGENGVKFTGNWMQKMGQLNTLLQDGTAEMEKLFGRENVASAAALASQTDSMASALKELKALGGQTTAGSVDLAKNITERRLSDPSALAAAKIEAAQQFNENVSKNPSMQSDSAAETSAAQEAARASFRTNWSKGWHGTGVERAVVMADAFFRNFWIASGESIKDGEELILNQVSKTNPALFKAMILDREKKARDARVEALRAERKAAGDEYEKEITSDRYKLSGTEGKKRIAQAYLDTIENIDRKIAEEVSKRWKHLEPDYQKARVGVPEMLARPITQATPYYLSRETLEDQAFNALGPGIAAPPSRRRAIVNGVEYSGRTRGRRGMLNGEELDFSGPDSRAVVNGQEYTPRAKRTGYGSMTMDGREVTLKEAPELNATMQELSVSVKTLSRQLASRGRHAPASMGANATE